MRDAHTKKPIAVTMVWWWRRSSLAKGVSTIAASCRCAANKKAVGRTCVDEDVALAARDLLARIKALPVEGRALFALPCYFGSR